MMTCERADDPNSHTALPIWSVALVPGEESVVFSISDWLISPSLSSEIVCFPFSSSKV